MQHHLGTIVLVLVSSVVISVTIGCTATNPSFPTSRRNARAELRQMKENPAPAQRPILILGGYLDPGVLTELMGDDLADATTGQPIITVSFSITADFEDCRHRVLKTIQDEHPELMGEPGSPMTEPFDVVAISMGGLVARFAALPTSNGDKQLHIQRLFTISTPHNGATLAYIPSFHGKQIDMRPGSDFLSRLNTPAPEPGYEMYCYVRLRDGVVGTARAAPPNHAAWWLDTPFWQSSHLQAPGDPRIVADILRRLRGETPLALDPPTPLP